MQGVPPLDFDRSGDSRGKLWKISTAILAISLVVLLTFTLVPLRTINSVASSWFSVEVREGSQPGGDYSGGTIFPNGHFCEASDAIGAAVLSFTGHTTSGQNLTSFDAGQESIGLPPTYAWVYWAYDDSTGGYSESSRLVCEDVTFFAAVSTTQQTVYISGGFSYNIS
jgi:hypothetical protein